MDFQTLIDAVKKGDVAVVTTLVEQGLAEGADPQLILDDGLLKAMNEVGVRFKNNEVFVPEVLIAARALNAGTAVLKEKIGDNASKIGKVVIATVSGDLHDIGKNLVKMMMESVGFNVIDLGVDVTADKIVEAVKTNEADIVALSALLTTTMAYQRTVVDALKEAGIRDKVKVMIGGAPTTQAFCDDIGADGYTADAPSAADKARELLA
ncbi:MAG: corrinoid protein [Clostridiales Family XIII bacterium]|jgi:5-methyltetrahydrofolate--homocysteine methyltransferase|nr:corrinoid protein [Clostridiales Family XIII bacterium]